MIYAYDQALQMPTKDLYDTQMMAMALNTAKDMYERGEQQIKDFNKQYGDFYSPIAADMKWYDENVTGRMRRVVDNLYARGIDPLRSAEGRAIIAREIASTPIGTINAMKTNAALYEKRLDAIAKLGDKYNRNMDIALNGDPTQFSTVGDRGLNTFDYAPPAEYKNLDQLLEPIIANVKPSYDEAKTKADTDHRIWTTISQDRLMQAFNDNMSDILSTPAGRYLLMQSQQEAEAINRLHPGTNISGMDVLKTKAANRLSDHVQESFTYDPVWLQDREHKQRLAEKMIGNNPNNPTITPRQFSERVQTRIGQSYFSKIPQFAQSYARMRSTILNGSGKQELAKRWNIIANNLQSGKFGFTELKKIGLIDDDGNPTRVLLNHIMKYSPKEYWETRTYTPSSDYERDLFMNLFAGTSRTASVLGTDHNEIQLGDAGVHYAKRRYDLLSGNDRSGIEKEFDAWLQQNNIAGYVENKPTLMANIAQPHGTNLTEWRNNVLISYDDFYKFADQYAANHNISSKKAVEDIAKKLGLTKRVDPTYTNAIDGTYYSMPIIRSSNMTLDDVNQQYNKSTYGTTAASEERRAAENAAYRFLFEN